MWLVKKHQTEPLEETQQNMHGFTCLRTHSNMSAALRKAGQAQAHTGLQGAPLT